MNYFLMGVNKIPKLITVSKAKEEIKRLQRFVELVESYEEDTIDKKIIKEYAYTNSIEKVHTKLNVDKEYINKVIRRLGKDELHKLIRTGYMQKTKHNRRKYK